MLDMLFKRTATGAIQVWEIETDVARGRYRYISGKLGGKMTVSQWTQAEPKNVGRSNATTASEQVMVEAKAAWEKKQRDGYHLTIGDAEGSEHTTYTFQCMLAKSYDEPLRKQAVLAASKSGRLVSQPKLDGVRLIATKGAMMSRKNRPVVCAPHVERALLEFFEILPNVVLDGELYAHELKDDFDELVSLARKQKPTVDDLKLSEKLSYHVYDCFDPEQPGWKYTERYAHLEVHLGHEAPHIILVPFHAARNELEIDARYQEYLSEGYEGQMLRIDAPYENKRSDKLVKRKEYQDAEFKVLSIEEGEGNRSGQAGFAVVTSGNGTTFKASIAAPLVKRLELLRNARSYVGRPVTVRFNGRTPAGIPRFPRAVAWYPEGRDV